MNMELIYIILFSCVPMYFLCRWVMCKRQIGSPKRRWLKALIPTIIVTPIFIGGLMLLILILLAYIPNKKFTKERWDENPGKRYTISMDIIDRGILMNKTPEEVTGLLGSKNQYVIHNDSVSQITYFLGLRSSLMVTNLYYLDIVIERNKVVQVSQDKDNGTREYYLKEGQLIK